MIPVLSPLDGPQEAVPADLAHIQAILSDGYTVSQRHGVNRRPALIAY
jgi:hypothetical protein